MKADDWAQLLRLGEVKRLLRCSSETVKAKVQGVTNGGEQLYPLRNVIRYVASLQGMTLDEARREIFISGNSGGVDLGESTLPRTTTTEAQS